MQCGSLCVTGKKKAKKKKKEKKVNTSITEKVKKDVQEFLILLLYLNSVFLKTKEVFLFAVQTKLSLTNIKPL